MNINLPVIFDNLTKKSFSLRWEHLEKQRYYRVIVSMDLLGDLILTKIWGGIGRSTGRVTHLPCSTENEAKILIKKIMKMRKKHGYILIIDNNVIT